MELVLATFIAPMIVMAMVWIFGWIIRQWILADKYRELMKQKAAAPLVSNVTTWKITYRIGQKRISADFRGDTEGEALLECMKTCKPSTIISLTRNP